MLCIVLSGAMKEFGRNQKCKYWHAYINSDFYVKMFASTHRHILLLSSQKLLFLFFKLSHKLRWAFSSVLTDK